jgi:hypothetical protein
MVRFDSLKIENIGAFNALFYAYHFYGGVKKGSFGSPF